MGRKSRVIYRHRKVLAQLNRWWEDTTGLCLLVSLGLLRSLKVSAWLLHWIESKKNSVCYQTDTKELRIASSHPQCTAPPLSIIITSLYVFFISVNTELPLTRKPKAQIPLLTPTWASSTKPVHVHWWPKRLNGERIMKLNCNRWCLDVSFNTASYDR